MKPRSGFREPGVEVPERTDACARRGKPMSIGAYSLEHARTCDHGMGFMLTVDDERVLRAGALEYEGASVSTVRVDPATIGEDDDAELTTWLEPDGALVEADQPIAEITAAKVVKEVPAPAAGWLRHLVQAGAPLSAGQEIAVIVTAD